MSVRIQAADLREAARKAEAVRRELVARDEDPTVYLDVEVVIDRDAAAAFRVDSRRAPSGSVRYVGTPRGLAGLIADVQKLGIADGVCLVTADEDRVVGLMLDELAPGLAPAEAALSA
jgi:alkanesulfonate monooxygenase SsuD/methylene tetrahydromethanopterin reductase-like flavin-dependent oxidoreductase (luciferase family)